MYYRRVFCVRTVAKLGHDIKFVVLPGLSHGLPTASSTRETSSARGHVLAPIRRFRPVAPVVGWGRGGGAYRMRVRHGSLSVPRAFPSSCGRSPVPQRRCPLLCPPTSKRNPWYFCGNERDRIGLSPSQTLYESTPRTPGKGPKKR